MSYQIGGSPLEEHMSALSYMYEVSLSRPGSVLYWMKCRKSLCNECFDDVTAYRSCPVCGSPVQCSFTVYTCSCGTLIHACGPVVTRFVSEVPPETVIDDAI